MEPLCAVDSQLTNDWPAHFHFPYVVTTLDERFSEDRKASTKLWPIACHCAPWQWTPNSAGLSQGASWSSAREDTTSLFRVELSDTSSECTPGRSFQPLKPTEAGDFSNIGRRHERWFLLRGHQWGCSDCSVLWMLTNKDSTARQKDKGLCIFSNRRTFSIKSFHFKIFSSSSKSIPVFFLGWPQPHSLIDWGDNCVEAIELNCGCVFKKSWCSLALSQSVHHSKSQSVTVMAQYGIT